MNLVYLALTAVLLQAPPSSGLRLPHYDWNACPFECCIYRTWVAKQPIGILKERRLGAPVAFSLKGGEAVQAFTGVVVTRAVGRAVALQDGFVGNANRAIKAGEAIEIVRPEGEGFWKIWFKGQFDSAELLNLDDAVGFTVDREPQVTWWVRVRTRNGLVGWTIETHLFSGTDQCGC